MASQEQVDELIEQLGDLSTQMINLMADNDMQREALNTTNQRLEATINENANQRRMLDQAGARLEENRHVQEEQNFIL